MPIRTIVLAILLLASPGWLAAEPPKPYTKNVAIVVYDGVELLDFAGPVEVLQNAARFGANGQDPAFKLYTVSRTKEPVLSLRLVHVTPDYSIADSPKPDILILPGGGAESVLDDPAWMEWVKTSGRDAEVVMTVCTGAFIAGRAGLLDGIEATTWYAAIPGLREEFPNTRVQTGRRFVDSGKVITTAGVSAGIDGSLHLVARLLGRAVADRTTEYMEYKWTPDSYLTAHYVQLNPRLDDHGHALQQASILTREGNPAAAIAIYRALLAADAKDAEAWLNLGRVLHAEKRYDEAITAHLEAAKAAPQRPIALFNLACAYALKGEREKAIDAATKAVAAGFRIKWYYAQDADLAAIRDDGRFKALVAGL
ncbi:MAG TPA: DJ-1/PfpI family protein [Thermoanaerobaculia bacterium]|nr:DJ-1/PfpI family protein [Thermoanaerobaculia bacterium]